MNGVSLRETVCAANAEAMCVYPGPSGAHISMPCALYQPGTYRINVCPVGVAFCSHLIFLYSLNWRVPYTFGGLVHYHHDGGHGGVLAGTGAVGESYILIWRQRECERKLEPGMGFWILKVHV